MGKCLHKLTLLHVLKLLEIFELFLALFYDLLDCLLCLHVDTFSWGFFRLLLSCSLSLHNLNATENIVHDELLVDHAISNSDTLSTILTLAKVIVFSPEYILVALLRESYLTLRPTRLVYCKSKRADPTSVCFSRTGYGHGTRHLLVQILGFL